MESKTAGCSGYFVRSRATVVLLNSLILIDVISAVLVVLNSHIKVVSPLGMILTKVSFLLNLRLSSMMMVSFQWRYSMYFMGNLSKCNGNATIYLSVCCENVKCFGNAV